MDKKAAMDELRDLRARLTMKFAGARRPSKSEISEIEGMRERIAELEDFEISDVSHLQWYK